MRQFDAYHGAIFIATSRDDHLPQSIPISNANPRSAATPANRSILKCNSTDPHRVDDDGDWEPHGYPYELRRGVYHQSATLRCGVYHQSATLYAAVLMHQSATKYAAVFHTKALLLYMLRCSRTKATKYTAVSTPKLPDAEMSIISIEADVVQRCLLF